MISMTGHGGGRASVGGFHATVECSSVNRKQTEISLATAREYLHLEPRIRDEIVKRIARGRVNVSVEILADQPGSLIDAQRARSYLRELMSVQDALKLSGPISLETVLDGPGVIRSGAASGDPWPAVKAALDHAMDALISMRRREGAHLQKVIRREIRALDSAAKKIHPLAKLVPVRQRAMLEERLSRAGLPVDVSNPRIATEVALFAERCDISEELDRLQSHSEQFAGLLEKSGPVGRTMEFLAQETGREWNTIGSKANDARISRFVVEAKAALDRLREQLANIE
jgi:uncharacterized protein (TIGR00255 family)